MEWTEVKIVVENSSAEQVANFIHEANAGGVVVEPGQQNTTLVCYFPRGEQSRDFIVNFNKFALHLDLNSQVSVDYIAEQDWEEEWKKYYHPVTVGNIIIAPSWLEVTAQSDQLIVELDPGMAFGTGIHATTQMCLLQLQKVVQPGSTVLDLGTGSGILAIGAAKLGAQVDAVDNDDIAVDVAVDNAEHNKCSIQVRQGDAFEIFRQDKSDIIVANIGFEACAQLARIYQQLGKKGVLILSGFPKERMQELCAEIEDKQPVETYIEDEWGCLVLQCAE